MTCSPSLRATANWRIKGSASEPIRSGEDRTIHKTHSGRYSDDNERIATSPSSDVAIMRTERTLNIPAADGRGIVDPRPQRSGGYCLGASEVPVGAVAPDPVDSEPVDAGGEEEPAE